jgi:hypothetical protein
MSVTKDTYSEVSISTYSISQQDVADGPNKTIYGNNTNFIVKLPNRLVGVSAIEISSAQIPTSFNTINSSNNTLIVNTGGGDISVAVNEGNYIGVDLANELKTKLNAVSTNWDVSYSNITYKFTFTRGVGTFIIKPSGTINKILGLTSTSPTDAVILYEAPAIANVNVYNYMYIMSDSLLSYKRIKPIVNGENKNILAKIPFSNTNGTSQIIYTKILTNKILFPSRPVISSFDIKLVDPSGAQIELNKLPWALSILFYYN